MNKNNIDELNGIYQDIAEICDYDVALTMYNNYRGLQITFPNKFKDSNSLHSKIFLDYNNGKNVKELARNYGYSERYIRTILSKLKNYWDIIDPTDPSGKYILNNI